MAKATWNGATLAETDDIAHVEGNAYFPISAVNKQYLSESSETRQTYCHWKGIAEYYDINVNGETNVGGAWFSRVLISARKGGRCSGDLRNGSAWFWE